MNYDYTGRVYKHLDSGYWFTKTWGCYRLFDESNKEIFTFKTTDRLDYVKKIASGVIANQNKQAV